MFYVKTCFKALPKTLRKTRRGRFSLILIRSLIWRDGNKIKKKTNKTLVLLLNDPILRISMLSQIWKKAFVNSSKHTKSR